MTSEDESSACFAHLLVDGHVVDPQTARDVAVFRKAERQRLYGLRKAIDLEGHRQMARVVGDRLTATIGDCCGKAIAAYWPIRGELDLRAWMAEACNRGATLALPVVVEKQAPVVFHRWQPGTAMKKGIWNIPVPRSETAVIPDIVICPLVGVDEAGFRLGNGGGYYDRTLARLPKDTMVIGVGQGFCRLKTIFPQPWDIAMQHVILAGGGP